MQQTKTTSIEPQRKAGLPEELSWNEIQEPGAYVECGSGDLYRLPKEALAVGASPIAVKETSGASRFIQISTNPFVTSLEARLRCARHNIEPNF